jgi:hypothetical protein
LLSEIAPPSGSYRGSTLETAQAESNDQVGS